MESCRCALRVAALALLGVASSGVLADQSAGLRVQKLAVGPDIELVSRAPVLAVADRGPGCQVAANCQAMNEAAGSLGTASSDTADTAADSADNITFAVSGNITSVCFWGTYQDASVHDPSSESFTITYLADAGGFPDVNTVVGGPFVVGNPTPTAGTTLTREADLGAAWGAGSARWSATHPAVAVTAGQCVWLQIQGNNSSTATRWRWSILNANAANDDGVVVQKLGTATAYAANTRITGFDFGWCVNVANAPNACPVPLAPNARCTTAQPLAIGASINGDTALGLNDPSVPFCGDNPVNGNTLWYSVVGNGTTLTASTCSANTNFDTVINVYCGDTCASLNCVANNDTDARNIEDPPLPGCTPVDDFADPSTVSWVARNGTTYYIAVYGFELDAGTFTMSLTSDSVVSPNQPACVSDRCPVSLAGVANPEPAPCGTLTLGCIDTPPYPIALNQLAGGTSFNVGTQRDFDFWTLTLAQNTWLDVTLDTEFPGRLQVFTGTCEADGTPTNFVGDASPFVGYCDTGRTAQFEAPAGQVWFNIITNDFGGVPCAPGNNNYTLLVTPSVVGACCLGDESCSVTTTGDCEGQEGIYRGDNSACGANTCDGAGCRADFNRDGTVNVSDIFAFLSAWFSNAPGSDFDNSGATNVSDIFAFLSAWFAGCP